ncbi:tRNAHis guanylyltransferase-domain-containing protein [Lactarius indigo]|nr:tRNAHis guanylyltransferase-domain-containing protein [Lactarius indigo]
MAGSRWAYVRNFELPDTLLPNTFILLRIDGHSFHRLTTVRALELMDLAAWTVMREYPDIVLAYGESDEYSFLLRKSTKLYNRRQSKITSLLCSLFTSAYVMFWPQCFPDTRLRYAPSFDARIVLYPGAQEVRDYFSWRQADTHVNNLYNTTFWALVQQGGQTTKEAHETLSRTISCFRDSGINYNDLPRQFRKGSTIVKDKRLNDEGEADIKIKAGFRAVPDINEAGVPAPEKTSSEKRRARATTKQRLLYSDIIADGFWRRRPYLLEE